MNTIYLIVGIIVVIGIAAAVFLGGGVGHDFDAIIAEKNCEVAGSLTEAELESATVEQQIKLSGLIVGCMMGG